ncbi:hypothetical protein [Mycobacterium sp. 155]|uniref:hypothetical protein n=1 Tax=Mycobacterium sp. 155 TaxID=1157943 RepID=UPI0012FC21D6|nr:hypothetical protein [Mycobacterium sp. 155]
MRFWKRDAPTNNGTKPKKPIRVGFVWQIVFCLLVGFGLAGGLTYAGWRVLGSPPVVPKTSKQTAPNQSPAPSAQPPSSPQAPPNELPVDVSLDLLRISLTVVAGVGGIVALVVAYRKQRLGEAQHQREDSAARREDQKMYSERFSKASELLGSQRSAMRLAGVYAMASLADDWEGGRQTCIDVLCAYLRMPHKPLNDPPIDQIRERPHRPSEQKKWRLVLSEDSNPAPSEEHQVRTTIIRVIVDHLDSEASTPWFGHSFNLSGAILDSPSFAGAHIHDCYFDFGESLLYGEIDFSGCDFVDSKIDFFFTDIVGKCEFDISDFRNTEIQLTADISGGVKFYASNMESTTVDISGLDLDGGDFSFMEINMKEKSTLEIGRADLKQSSLALSRCHVSNSKIVLRNASLTNSSMYFSGLRVEAGGRVMLTSGIHNKTPSPEIMDSELHFNDMGISAGGFFGLQRQNFIRSPLHFPDLSIDKSEFIITECHLNTSAVSFTNADLSSKGRLVIDVCSDDENPVNTDGLTTPPGNEGLSVVVRPGAVDDVDPSLWARARTRQDAEVDPALRPHIVAWY